MTSICSSTRIKSRQKKKRKTKPITTTKVNVCHIRKRTEFALLRGPVAWVQDLHSGGLSSQVAWFSAAPQGQGLMILLVDGIVACS